ncbi:uncharacterized protein LOC131215724 [Anopheles bellator]|uniref:uncharacterized protein LOC131215724 n=1 Tax=Anopheles bellator TaxID=139047 RepID=UPI002647E079|nr:uncharacterized protein LOC131215724 [Anopheles bellator]
MATQSTGVSYETLRTFNSLGCNDEALCYAAYRVYIHLKDEKKLNDVQYHYAPSLQLVYLTARRAPSAPAELYIPTLATEELALERLDHYRSLGEFEGLILAICDPSSTVLLYRATAGLKDISGKLPSRGKLLRQKQQQQQTEAQPQR